jgi:hypothetical protein
MTIHRRSLLIAALPALLLSIGPSAAAQAAAWDGTWKGLLGKRDPWPVSVTIAAGKVVSYSEKGAAFGIDFSTVTPTTVLFGDRDHYAVKIKRTGDRAASARIHGRIGYGYAVLTRQ